MLVLGVFFSRLLYFARPTNPTSALSEAFLQRVMSMYTAAHYKNSPNDLQLLSDAPAHELYCLLGPRARDAPKVGKDGKPVLPDVLCVVQVTSTCSHGEGWG